jgi:hypothetical protein
MTIVEWEALAQRLGQAERELQHAQWISDGSEASRARLASARAEYRDAEHQALKMLGARAALDLVEALSEPRHAAWGSVAPRSSRRAAASQ